VLINYKVKRLHFLNVGVSQPHSEAKKKSFRRTNPRNHSKSDMTPMMTGNRLRVQPVAGPPGVVSASRAAWQCVQIADQWKLSWSMMTATDSKTNKPSATHNWQRNMTGKGGERKGALCASNVAD
jgi:hypothetical protein